MDFDPGSRDIEEVTIEVVTSAGAGAFPPSDAGVLVLGVLSMPMLVVMLFFVLGCRFRAGLASP